MHLIYRGRHRSEFAVTEWVRDNLTLVLIGAYTVGSILGDVLVRWL